MSDTELILQRLESIELRLENIELTLSKVKHRALTPAEKMQRYRAKRRAAVTEKVTVTSVTNKVTSELETVTDAVTIPVTSVTSPRALINVPSTPTDVGLLVNPPVAKATPPPVNGRVAVLAKEDLDGTRKSRWPPQGTKRRIVWDAWLSATGRNGMTMYEGKREAKLRWALENYPYDDVFDAVHGWKNSEHHNGAKGKIFNDIELLLRDSTHLEMFRDYWRTPAKPVAGRGPKPSQEQLARQLAEDQRYESRFQS